MGTGGVHGDGPAPADGFALTRRAFVGGSLGAVVAPLVALADDDLVVEEFFPGPILEIRYRGHSTRIDPSSIGPAARVEHVFGPEGLSHRIEIQGFGGPLERRNDIGLTLLLTKVGAEWKVTALTRGWPAATENELSTVSASEWLAGRDAPGREYSVQGLVATALDRVGVRGVSASLAATLTKNLAWELRGSEGSMRALGDAVGLAALRLSWLPPGQGPLATMDSPATGSTLAEGIASFRDRSFSLGRAREVEARVDTPEEGSFTSRNWEGPKYRCTEVDGGPWTVRFAGSAGTEGPFLARYGRWQDREWKETPAGATLRARILSIELETKPFAIFTHAGRLVIAGHSGAADGFMPGLTIEARGSAITRVEGSAVISHAAVSVAGADFSRVDFDGATLAFALPEGALPSDRRDGLLTLGAGLLRMPLDMATVRIVRGADLVSLKFRFRGLALDIDGADASIVISPPAALTETPAVPPLPPLLIVTLPPQHVAERVYFRQTDRRGATLDVRDGPPRDYPQPGHPDFDRFKHRYRELTTQAGLSPTDYQGRVTLGTDQALLRIAETIMAELARRANGGLDPLDEFEEITEARISGESRLVFKVDAPDTPAQLFRVPFSVAGLTDWRRFTLSVVLRAESPVRPNPVSAPSNLESGFVSEEARVTELPDVGEKFLAAQQIWPSSPLLNPGERLAARMTDIRRSLAAPSGTETAIELPFRLFLSPDQHAKWVTPAAEPDFGRPVQLWHTELVAGPTGQSVRAVWSDDFRAEAFSAERRRPGPPPRGAFPPWRIDGQMKRPPTGRERFRTSLDANDRHELVGLTSIHGLPVLPRVRGGKTDASQVLTPRPYRITGDLNVGPSPDTPEEPEAIYRAQPLDVRELTLTALGGSIDVDTAFEPPSAIRVVSARTSSFWGGIANLFRKPAFDAFTVERWRQLSALGRDISVEVVYKGYLFPIGARAALVKVTERQFRRNPVTGGPTAYLIQRMFIRVSKPVKNFPALGMMYGGRGWPARRLKIITTRTPDIIDPWDVPLGEGQKESASGLIRLAGEGDAFWPRTSRETGGEVRFQVQFDGGATAIGWPLIFVDNRAVHSDASLRSLLSYYNDGMRGTGGLDGSSKGPYAEESELPLRRAELDHGSIERPFAPEHKPGDTTFPTRRWVVKAEGRSVMADGQPGGDAFAITPDMEGDDQPPFYPRLDWAELLLTPIERMTGQNAPIAKAFFDENEYLRKGLPASEWESKGAYAAREEDLDDIVSVEYPDRDTPDKEAAAEQMLDKVRYGFRTYRGNPFEIFMRLTQLQRVSIGDNGAGNRTGGLARPDFDAFALSRRQGLFGNNPTKTEKPPGWVFGEPTSTSVGPKTELTENNLPIPTRAEGLPQAPTFDPFSFFSDAKILGLISLRDVVKQAADEFAPPALKQVMEYGSSVIGDFIPIARDIVQGMTGILGEVVAAFDRIGQLPAQRTAIRRLYPDLNDALIRLQDTLTAATADLAREDEPDLATVDRIVAHGTNIYDAGQKFVGAIERIAADPLAPIRAAAQEAFDTLINELFHKYFGPLAGFPLDIPVLRDPQFWGERLIERAVDAIIDEKTINVTAARLNAFLFESVKQDFATLIDAGVKLGNLIQSGLVAGDDLAAAFEPLADAATGIGQIVARELEDRIADGIAATCNTLASPAALALKAIGFVQATANRIEHGNQGIDDQIRQLDDLGSVLNLLPINRYDLPGLDEIFDAVVEWRTAVADVTGSLRTGLAAVRGLLGEAKKLSDALMAPTTVPAGCFAFVDLVRFYVTSNPPEPLKVDYINLVLALPQFVGKDLEELVADATAKAEGLPAAERSPEVLLARATSEVVGLRRLKLVTDGLAERWTELKLGLTLDEKPIFEAVARAVEPAVSAVNAALSRVLAEYGALTKRVLDLGSAAAEIVDDPNFADLKRFLDAAKDAGVSAAIIDPATAFVGELETAAREARAAHTALDGILGSLETRALQEIRRATAATDIDGAFERLGALVLAEGIEVLDRAAALETRMHEVEVLLRAEKARLFDQLVRVVAGIAGFSDYYLTEVVAALEKPIDFLVAFDELVDDARAESWSEIRGLLAGGDGSERDLALAALLPALGEVVSGCMLVLADEGTACLVDGELKRDDDLGAELSGLLRLRDLVGNAHFLDLLKRPDNSEVVRLMRQFAGGRPAALRLAEQLVGSVGRILRTNIADLFDFDDIKRRIENEIRKLIPSKVRYKYDFETRLGPVDPVFRMESSTARDLVIHTETVIDLLNDPTPKVTIRGELAPFVIDLFGEAPFDIVTLYFERASFVSEDGGKPDFSIRVREFRLGSAVAFLEVLQSYLSFSAHGFEIKPIFSPFGIQASYTLDLGLITIGNLGFLNVGLAAVAQLPFDSSEPHFKASISTKDVPFTICAMPYGGGGFFGMIANSEKIIGFEASFEYGGVLAFNYGPLSAVGRMMMGLYVSKIGQVVTIEGYFFIGGSGRIACFGFSASFLLTMRHDLSSGQMVGRAIYSFAFKVGFLKFRFQIEVFKVEGKGFTVADSDSRMTAAGRGARTFQVANADGMLGGPSAAGAECPVATGFQGPGATIVSSGKCQSIDWDVYQSYFDHTLL